MHYSNPNILLVPGYNHEREPYYYDIKLYWNSGHSLHVHLVDSSFSVNVNPSSCWCASLLVNFVFTIVGY